MDLGPSPLLRKSPKAEGGILKPGGKLGQAGAGIAPDDKAGEPNNVSGRSVT